MITGQIFCPYCGTRQVKPNARFCHTCGKPMPAAPESAPPAPEPVSAPRAARSGPSRRLSAWWLLPLLLVATMGAITLAWEPARSRVSALLTGLQPAAAETAVSPVVRAPAATGTPALEPVALPAETAMPTATTGPTATPPPTATPLPTATPRPTATLVPTATQRPTATPSLTPAPAPAATPAPTAPPTAVACRIAPGDRFRALWQQERAGLGCALNQAAQSDAATERFQHGRMVWRSSNDMIYVVYDDGGWAAYPDVYVEGAPEPAGFQPPSGLITPVRGFGAIWRSKLGGTNARIGWATQDEYAVSVQVQDFEQGLMLEMEGKVYALENNGGRWLAK